MKKFLSTLYFILFIHSNVFAERGYVEEFTEWVNTNELNEYLDTKSKDKKGPKFKDTMGKMQNFDWSKCDTFYKPSFCYDENGLIKKDKREEADKKIKYIYPLNFKIPDNWFDRIPWDVKPSQSRLLYWIFHLLEDDKGWSSTGSKPSNEPFQFISELKPLDKEIKKKMEKTGLLSFLFFENGKITIDEITPKDKYGLLFNNQTKWTSASVGKSITSYVTGHAVCEGYIDNLDVKLSDWPLLKDTLFQDVTLIDLLNMAAGDQKFIKNHFRKDIGIKGRERNVNVNTIKHHMEGTFKGSKPKKNNYNYSNLNSNIILNYVWFKSNGDFQKILDKVFKEKARIENNVFFLKNNNRTVQNKYVVTDESGPLRYSFRATRYDYLRIAKAMMDDWQNDTCVGKYLKEINDRKISKNLKYPNKNTAYGFSKSYGGQFHLNFPGFKDRNIFGLDGAYGQSILIDMDKSKIIVINAAHEGYNWHKIALKRLK